MAGVSDTIRCGSAAMATTVPSSSVTSMGKAAVVGAGVGAADGDGEAGASVPRCGRTAARGERGEHEGKGERDAATSKAGGHRLGSPERGGLAGGVVRTHETPRFEACRRRGQGMVCTVLPTFLSKVRACTVGSATGLPPEGGSP